MDAWQYPFDIGPIFGGWEFSATVLFMLLTEKGDLRVILLANLFECKTHAGKYNPQDS